MASPCVKTKRICPHCGEKIPDTASACWYCGSDDRTGWSDDTYMDGIDLKEDFDYGSALEREFGTKVAGKIAGKRPRPWYLSMTAAVSTLLLIAFLLGIFQMIRC